MTCMRLLGVACTYVAGGHRLLLCMYMCMCWSVEAWA